jgi:hypothetical protein
MRRDYLNVSHAGHSGDIVYSLAFLRSYAFATGRAINFSVIKNLKARFAEGMKHPNGEYLMSEISYRFLEPLLSFQNYIGNVEFTDIERLPANSLRLDSYRDVKGIDLSKGNIASYLRKIFPFEIDLHNPFLSSPSARLPSSSIVCGFSKRYRNVSIDYSFLSEVPNLFFVGLPDEYLSFKQRARLDSIRYIETKNAIELASIIKQSSLFLGNQSLSFAIAEGLKVRRALELCEICPNVIPTGSGAFEFIHELSIRQILARLGLHSSADCPRKDPVYRLYLD